MKRITKSRRTPAAVAIAGLALLAAGCGSSAKPPSASNDPSPKDGAATAFHYAACMRSHGVSSFPDPKVSSSGPGEQTIAMMVSKGVVASPQFKTAQKACQGIMPQPNAAQIAQQQRQDQQGHLSFARCMRAHGVTSFPDPNVQGHLDIQMVAAAGIDIHAPAVLAAAKACVPESGGTVSAAAINALASGAAIPGSSSSASGGSGSSTGH